MGTRMYDHELNLIRSSDNVNFGYNSPDSLLGDNFVNVDVVYIPLGTLDSLNSSEVTNPMPFGRIHIKTVLDRQLQQVTWSAPVTPLFDIDGQVVWNNGWYWWEPNMPLFSNTQYLPLDDESAFIFAFLAQQRGAPYYDALVLDEVVADKDTNLVTDIPIDHAETVATQMWNSYYMDYARYGFRREGPSNSKVTTKLWSDIPPELTPT